MRAFRRRAPAERVRRRRASRQPSPSGGRHSHAPRPGPAPSWGWPSASRKTRPGCARVGDATAPHAGPEHGGRHAGSSDVAAGAGSAGAGSLASASRPSASAGGFARRARLGGCAAGRLGGGRPRRPGRPRRGPRRRRLRSRRRGRRSRPRRRRSPRRRSAGCHIRSPLGALDPLAFGVLDAAARLLFCELRLALDVDPPAGEARREPRVLAFLADGERQLEVGDDHFGDAGVLVDADLADLRRGERAS